MILLGLYDGGGGGGGLGILRYLNVRSLEYFNKSLDMVALTLRSNVAADIFFMKQKIFKPLVP